MLSHSAIHPSSEKPPLRSSKACSSAIYGEIETRLSAETAAAATKRKMRLMKYIRMARPFYSRRHAVPPTMIAPTDEVIE